MRSARPAIIALLLFALPTPALAGQGVEGPEIIVDTTLGMGLQLRPEGGRKSQSPNDESIDTTAGRAPVTLRIAPALAFPDSRWVEWTMGVSLPLESGPALGLHPGVRLRKTVAPVDLFLEGDLSALLQPVARFGFTVRGGTLWYFATDPGLAVAGGVDVNAYFPPGNSHEGGMRVEMLLSVGLRVQP